MEIIILGSSAAIPVKERNLSAIALRYRGETLLFDCGEDLQRRFIEAGLKFNKPLHIFISHFHGDHIIGLPGLLFRFSLSDRTAPLKIIGQRNLHAYLYFHHKILGLKANYPLRIYEIDHENQQLIEYNGIDAEAPSNRIIIKNSILFEKERYKVRYAPVNHSVSTYAYSFEENPRYGRFHPEKARELGIPESRLWKKLQSGKNLEYKGRIINPLKEGIVDPPRRGRKITYSGDTMPCDSLIKLGMDSDVIIHESTFSDELREVAHNKQHSTSVDAAQDAKKMNAKMLILTHISSRYQDDSQELLEEAKEIFPNTEIAEDLKRFKIK